MRSPAEVSSILGQYMLSGWTLTDVVCPKPGCTGCPLMRSRDGRTEFCARCDGGPSGASSSDAAAVTSAPSTSGSEAEEHGASHIRSISRLSQPGSRPSTPPTPPIVSDEDEDGHPAALAAVASPEELARRRDQSDIASKRIGELLIKGWAMLDDQCRSEECWGVPLMRSPKGAAPARQEQPKRGRFCVICERDWDAPASAPAAPSASAVDNALASASTEAAAAAGVYGQSRSSAARRKRRAEEVSPSSSVTAPEPHRARTTVEQIAPSSSSASPLAGLSHALSVLKTHLEAVSRPTATGALNVDEIAKTAEAVGRVWAVIRALES